MAVHAAVFWVFWFLSTYHAVSQLLEFSYQGFQTPPESLNLDGAAKVEDNGALRLTDSSQRVIGHAFYSSPARFKAPGKASVSFSTAFALAMVPKYPKLGGHGLAFTIAPSRGLQSSFPSQFLGLLNNTCMGKLSNHIFAVEFDTVKDYELGDMDDDHIGININSLISNASVPAAYFLDNSTRIAVNLEGGKVIQAWIDYDATKERVEVRISPFSEKPRRAILTFDVDLSPIFEEVMYVGFSASTGLLASSHYIFGWNFNMSGEAKSLTLSSLPYVPGPRRESRKNLILIAFVSASTSVLLIVALGFLIRRLRNHDRVESWELEVGPHRFSYQELKNATTGFGDKELLGFGGFGKVYKGTLSHSKTEIAVKRISHESKQGIREFMTEISSIGRLRHRNLVQLLGWCRKGGDLLLVYDFMPNGSLDNYLFDNPNTILSWDQRFKIIKGIASALLYLHDGWEQTVIHRDVKAANVLLDSDMNGRLGDFGLAKLYEHDSTPNTTQVVGTLGYLAPELTRSGKPSKNADVYAFGAVVLEVVCGRKPIEPKALPEKLILIDWVWDMWRGGSVLEVVDKRLKEEFNEVEAVAAVKLGLLCSYEAPESRPTMRHIVMYLEGEMELPQPTPAKDSMVSNESIVTNDREDFVHSFPGSVCGTEVDTRFEAEVEALSASTLSIFSREDGR